MNLLLDEAVIPKDLWAKAPRQVSIALTNACDLSCAHCYAPKKAAQLPWALLVHWLAELDVNSCLGVGFGGGEPTLYRQFAQLCQHAAHRTGLAVTFTTHAHRIDDDLASELRGNVHFIRVSMDGVGPTYESIRGRSFTDFRCRLATIRSIAPFGINFVVNRTTFPDLDAAVKIASDEGASEFLLLPEQPSRQTSGIDAVTLLHLRQWIGSVNLRMRLSVSDDHADGLPVAQPFRHELGLSSYAHIDAEGYLRRNSYSPLGIPIGNGGIIAALGALRQKGDA